MTYLIKHTCGLADYPINHTHLQSVFCCVLLHEDTYEAKTVTRAVGTPAQATWPLSHHYGLTDFLPAQV